MDNAQTAPSPAPPTHGRVTLQGATTMADDVVSTIAGLAVKEVPGVHALGSGTARAVEAVRERVPGGRTTRSRGVTAEVGNREAAVDVVLVADHGVPLAALADAVRRNVVLAVDRMTGLRVTEVNVEIGDLFLPGVDVDPDPDADLDGVDEIDLTRFG